MQYSRRDVQNWTQSIIPVLHLALCLDMELPCIFVEFVNEWNYFGQVFFNFGIDLYSRNVTLNSLKTWCE